MLLPWLNFTLFGVQILVNRQHARKIGPASRRYNTPITPAPYAFQIWGLIYSLLIPTLLLDCLYPQFSFFDASNHPNLLRMAYSLSCLANISWILLFPKGLVHISTVIIILLWISLLPLYVSITDNWRDNSFMWTQFLGSELSIMIYCAWTCIAASISVSISLQVMQEKPLPVEIYIGIISLLVGLCSYANMIRHEIISSVVAVWALTAIIVRRSGTDSRIANDIFGVRCCAIQAAITISVLAMLAQLER